jgi:hypothetical protein
MMWRLHAGLRILWWSLFTVVVLAWSPNAPPKVAVDHIPVAIVGSDGLKALALATVLLMADGILPLSTLSLWSFILCVSFCLQLALFMSVWFGGRANVTCLSSSSTGLARGA